MKSLSSTRLIIATSAFLVLFGNVAFFSNVTDVYPVSIHNSGFLISLAVLLGCATSLLLALSCHRYTLKPVLITLLVASSITAYFMDTYNVVIDDIMVGNTLATNTAEASDLLSLRFAWYLLLLGILPSTLVYKARIDYGRPRQAITSRLVLIVATLALAITTVLIFSNFYASFFREHKPLRYYANPVYYIYSTAKYAGSFTTLTPREFTAIAQDALIPPSDVHRELVILVVGETARADHFSLNGYTRETNPYLRNKNVISFTNFWACGTSTAHSLPCLFSIYDHTQFDKTKVDNTGNALDVLQHAGVNVLWLDNNSDSKGVALRVPFEDYRKPEKNPVCDTECRDEGMLANLQAYIDAHPTGDIFIVLHQMGNHGPDYYKRYPENFEVFKPACQTNQLEDCSSEEINNAYDNAILYTDYFLAKTIDLLEHNNAKFESALIYVSDHGESLGENGIYLHGLPYMIAPDNQKHVPVILWLNDSLLHDINLESLQKSRHEKFSHDNIFHTLLGLMEVHTSAYDRKMDLIEHTND